MWARRHLPVYRWVADLDDKTIAGLVAAGWVVWVVGGFLTAVLGLPGAALVGLLLAVAGVVVNVVAVSWWMGYRRSPARLRHQILARTQIAAGRELSDCSLSAAQAVDLGAHVRPALAAQTAPQQTGGRALTATGPHGATRDVQPGELPVCSMSQEGASW
ncbi:hypothetical protein [Cellulomonas sp. RIT-PI-Y]|uniref:hypothetical protein n=1 Tax=Cellulomonas sp. RIT-PI-Y TaxID=3035297 RepID=UPI0021D82C3C|nr:hypothetical protein [Cellulomonas sp. RIT-PI-Y]